METEGRLAVGGVRRGESEEVRLQKGSRRDLAGTGGSVSASVSPSWCDTPLQFATCYRGGNGIKDLSVLFLATACESTIILKLKVL